MSYIRMMPSKKNYYKVWILLYALCSFCILFGITQIGQATELRLSVIYVLIHCVGIYLIWSVSNKKLGIFMLYQITFALFIGGRFYAYLLNPSLDLDIFRPTFFFDYHVNYNHKIEIFSYLLFFIIFSIIGYSFVRRKHQLRPIFNIDMTLPGIKRVYKIGNMLFPIFLVYTLYNSVSSFITAISGGGYLSLYIEKNSEYSSGGGFLPNLILFFLAFSFAYDNHSLQKRYLILYLSNCIVGLMIGGRGGFGALLLFLVWLYSLRHKVNIAKLGITILGALVLLLYLFSFSIRSSENNSGDFSFEDLFANISMFLYTNGISLMVFDASRLIESYPPITYVGALIPGSVWVWSKLTGVTQPDELYFSYHMCYNLNPSLFRGGSGLGWTTLSDIYMLSFHNLFLFIILSLLFGVFFAMLESFSERYPFYKYLVFYLFMACMLMPRSTLVVPLLIYGVAYFIIFYWVFNLQIFKRIVDEKKH